MVEHLKSFDASADIEFGREEAIYWFANDYHGGQGSGLYRALCASAYRPGPLARSPQSDYAFHMYDALVGRFAN
jgi:hypothetical protein